MSKKSLLTFAFYQLPNSLKSRVTVKWHDPSCLGASAQLPNQGEKKFTSLFLLSLLPSYCLRGPQTLLPGESSFDTFWKFLDMRLFDTVGQKRRGKKSNSCYFSLVCSSHCRYVMSLKERRRDIWIFCICTVWIFMYCPCWIKTKKGLFHLGSALGLNSN